MKNERALLEQAKQVDQVALGKLYDQYAPRIYAYIYWQVGEARLAEVFRKAGLTHIRRAAESPFNLILEVRR